LAHFLALPTYAIGWGRDKIMQKQLLLSGLNRREFLRLSGILAAGLAAGCAANPVTGKSQLMLVSEQDEIKMDKQHSPHQISADFGPLQDKALNDYITGIGKTMAQKTHRPQMPYDIKGVNATYVNAYAFPGGTIACTRGILLTLENEAELAALIGHELGHVNARHTAEIMSKNMITSAIVGGAAAYIGTRNASYGGIAAQLGMLGSGVLLASYSRDNERQADHLGMAYMVKSGYSPEGMVGLMDMLNSMSKHKQNATQLLFATHPMSSERYQTAVKMARSEFATAKGQPLHRERYMDHTAALRKIGPAIQEMQKGDALMAQKKFAQAEGHYKKALAKAPQDYAALMMMARCQLAQKKTAAAGTYTAKAKAVYPAEAQGYYLNGFVMLRKKRYTEALNDFTAYEKRLPGNPNAYFFKGYAHEGMDQRKAAADEYYRYLKVVREGEKAQHAYGRLVEWGYLKQ
jgi:predicted Zn-dependent protease